MTTSEREIVAALGGAIAQRIGEPRYKLWFEPNTKFRLQDGLLTVGVPNHFFQDWLAQTYTETVQAAANEIFGAPLAVRFVIDPELFQAARRLQAEGGSPARPISPAHAVEKEATSEKRAKLSSPLAANAGRTKVRRNKIWRRLDDFVAGACNRVAHASAVSIVENPGEAANPLILFGPVGTGKTHLLEAIYVGLRRRQPGWRVTFAGAEDFTNRFVQAMRTGKIGSFRHHFRNCDALLVDDLHFLAPKRATQEEFLHTFDAVQANGALVVLTCDCHPRLSEQFTPELRDRLLGGAVWGLAPPDPDTRLAILRTKSARLETVIPDEVLRFLAERLRGNVRELEGALQSVVHFSRVTGKRVQRGLAEEALGELLRHSIRMVRLTDVEEAVCRTLGLTGESLRSADRSWASSQPRMLAMYLSRKHTTATYGEIGQHFGKRNHSTVVAAEKRVRQWIEEDKEFTLGERRHRVRHLIEQMEREILR